LTLALGSLSRRFECARRRHPPGLLRVAWTEAWGHRTLEAGLVTGLERHRSSIRRVDRSNILGINCQVDRTYWANRARASRTQRRWCCEFQVTNGLFGCFWLRNDDRCLGGCVSDVHAGHHTSHIVLHIVPSLHEPIICLLTLSKRLLVVRVILFRSDNRAGVNSRISL
jgi:hypothetical protein